MISKKIDINEVNQDCNSPLHYACYFADTDLVGKLLDAGSEISHKDKDGLRATDFAAAADKVEILSALFEKAAALGIKDERIKRWKDEALFIAADNNKEEAADFLISQSADVSKALFFAAEQGSEKAVGTVNKDLQSNRNNAILP